MLRKFQGKNKEEELQKIKENLSLEVKNYQRKTLLSGIGQQETLGEHYDLVQQAIAQGISPIAVSNFKGKEVLDNLRGLKVVYDKDYFNKQTFEEYLVDPLGTKLIDAWAASDSAI